MHFSYTNHVVIQNIYNLAGREGVQRDLNETDDGNNKKKSTDKLSPG